MTTSIDANVAIIGLAEAKEYLKVTTNNDDAILAHLINGISSWIRDFTKRDFVKQTYTEYYSGDGSFDLILKNRPIVTLTSVCIDQLRTFPSTNLVDLTNIIVKKGAGVLRAFNLLYGFTWGESNIKVVYDAGYTVATDGGNTGTMPYDVRMAVKRLLDKHYRMGYTQHKLDVKSESISGMNITFDTDAVPKDVQDMLLHYRRLLPSPQYEYAD